MPESGALPPGDNGKLQDVISDTVFHAGVFWKFDDCQVVEGLVIMRVNVVNAFGWLTTVTYYAATVVQCLPTLYAPMVSHW